MGMTIEEAIGLLERGSKYNYYDSAEDFCKAYDMAIDIMRKYQKIEQEPTTKNDLAVNAVSRQAVMDCFKKWQPYMATRLWDFEQELSNLPSVTPQEPKTGHCKDCKFFEYDSVSKVDGIPLIVAHEICSRWGDGCKTKEDGYCFMFESQESEVKNG